MIPNIIRRHRPQPERTLKLLPVPSPKPKLEMRAVPEFRVKRRALEAYIAAVYRFEFDFYLATGLVAGQCPEFNVTGTLDSDAWRQRAHELRCGMKTRSVSLILTVLAMDGFIPAGKYVIDTHEAT